MDILKYKGYEGTTEIDMEQSLCRGKILFIHDIVTYKADNPQKIQQAFKDAVDDYLETCDFLKREPQKPLKGQYNIRVSPELHKQAVLRAYNEGVTLNKITSKALDSYINSPQDINHNLTININDPSRSTETRTVTPSTEPTWDKGSTYVQ